MSTLPGSESSPCRKVSIGNWPVKLIPVFRVINWLLPSSRAKAIMGKPINKERTEKTIATRVVIFTEPRILWKAKVVNTVYTNF
jgi:hypothetical protein